MSDPGEVADAIHDEVGKVLIGNEDLIERLTISLLTEGHILLEGVPGVAKTTMANLIARAAGLAYNRIQMTPDVLPADVTGTKIYRENRGEFELQKGPVFSNILVADEINRATPKTQSALLEAMEEHNATIEGETHSLPEPFLVIATQNPIEMEGTFELPEAQRDRFQFKLTVDLPDREMEAELLDRFDANPNLSANDVSQVVSPDELLEARQSVADVYVADPVKEYILDLVAATRSTADVEYGASPRATLAFLQASKARAAIRDREYVIPDDVKALAEPILAHRLVLSTNAELSDISPTEIVDDVIQSVSPPGAEADFAASQAPEPPAVGDGGETDIQAEDTTDPD